MCETRGAGGDVVSKRARGWWAGGGVKGWSGFGIGEWGVRKCGGGWGGGCSSAHNK